MQKILPGKLRHTATRRQALRDDIRIKEVVRCRLDVFREDVADDGAQSVVAANKHIGPRVLKIDRPGHHFIPRPGGAVQGNRGERVAQELIGGALEVIPAVHTMQVQRGVELGKFCARHEDITPAGKIRPHFNARVCGFFWIRHFT
jgi:hypothetical protein